MKTKFGVRSATPANKRLKNGYTLYDWVMRQKCFPDFWGRSISGADRLTEDELAFLRERGCKILLVMDELTEQGVSRMNGADDALRAVEVATALGVPQHQNIAIFADIKPDWSVNHNWMISFAQMLSANGYIPGFIGNTDSSKNFNFDRQCSHFVQATGNVGNYGAIYMATEPKLDVAPEVWEPFCPSALEPENMSLWVCGKTVFGSITTDDIYMKDEKTLEKLW